MSVYPNDTGADTGAAPKGPPRWLRDIFQILAPAAAAAAAFMIVFTFILGIGSVHGSSMAPLYDDYSIVLFSRGVQPEHQDIALIQSSALKDEIIKRVIGLPGDTLGIKGGVVYLNGQPLDEPYVEYPAGWEMDEMTIPEHMLFVMGDNRAASLDSRSPLLGLVPDSEVTGIVFFSFQSPVSSGFFQKIRQDPAN